MYPNFSNSDNRTWNKSEKYKIREFKTTNLDRVLLEKATVPQLVKKLPAFDEARRLVTVFTTAYHLPLS
jgi:LPS O-antigen subunit length determinant protein (WzzB/FepE family)